MVVRWHTQPSTIVVVICELYASIGAFPTTKSLVEQKDKQMAKLSQTKSLLVLFQTKPHSKGSFPSTVVAPHVVF